jgi:2,3-bisphosphoglycerate-independent phosphoglycerate mutase
MDFFKQTISKYAIVLSELESKRYRESEYVLNYILENIWKRHPDLESFTIRPSPNGCYVTCKNAIKGGNEYIKKLQRDLVEEPQKHPLFANQVKEEIQEELDLALQHHEVYTELEAVFKTIPANHIRRKYGVFEKITFLPDETKVEPWITM